VQTWLAELALGEIAAGRKNLIRAAGREGKRDRERERERERERVRVGAGFCSE
jgi:hypothetical protein